MEDKRLRERLDLIADEKLVFTKEDRYKVFEQIRKQENNDISRKPFISPSMKFAPLIVSLFVMGLCVFLFIPSTLFEKFSQQPTISNVNKEEHTPNLAGTPVSEEDEIVTTLLTVKDEQDRVPLNLLVTYSKNKNRLKAVSIPRDTYIPIIYRDDQSSSYTKLTFAYIHDSGGAQHVREKVSELLNVTIDQYAVMDLATFSALIDAVNGIDYKIPENIQVRAISQVMFEFEKGLEHLNGEQIVALLMASTGGLDEASQTELMNAVIHKVQSEMSQDQLQEFVAKFETNVPFDALEKPVEKIQVLSVSDGIKSENIEGAYYIKFEPEFLEAISQQLMTFE